jgi:hypothetical protein
MDPALRIEILCDKVPAQHDVVAGIVAALGHRLGTWTVTIHERHGGHCWDVRLHHPDGPDEHYVFLGEDRTAEHIRRTIEGGLRLHWPEPPCVGQPHDGRPHAGRR